MNVLFEEDGAFRAGSLMQDNVASVQVELPGGKRCKVKAANVLLRFERPAAGELMARAEADAPGIDVPFLWEVAAEGEFAFTDLAADYCGGTPDAVQAATLLLCLHSAPIYFHRKGKGRYRKAPPEILAAALAGAEKKRQQALAIEAMTEQLLAGQLPESFAPLLDALLYAPERSRPETRALDAACARSGLAAAALLHRCGALRTTHDYHLGRFLHDYFPAARGGTDFADYTAPQWPDGALDALPLATVRAFSIDDAATTEIDDAFSVQGDAQSGWRIGIHIAAPALGFAPDSDLGGIARTRLSTVYLPGRKITMLPDAVVEQFTLAAGRTVPALSLYLDVAGDLRITGSHSVLERVPVVANLRHHDIEPRFNAETIAAGLADFDFRDELLLLHELAQVLEAGRGQVSQAGRHDYAFAVDWTRPAPDVAGGEAGWVSIVPRPRGSPLDTLVAELMIHANATWGALLKTGKVPALYRVQSNGKVRMSTQAAAHEGLGLACYAWCTSPLRRYSDLLNQWQLIALMRNEAPPFAAKSATLYGALRDFELTYAAYAAIQRAMERYWCLRYLLQEGGPGQLVSARIIREQLVRLETLPLVIRLLDLPDPGIAAPGRRVRLCIEQINLLDADIRARFVELLPMDAASAPDDVDPDSALDDIDTAGLLPGLPESANAADRDAGADPDPGVAAHTPASD